MVRHVMEKTQSIKTLVSIDGFHLNSRLWKNHLKTYVEEGEVFEPISMQLQTVEGVELIRARVAYLLQWDIEKRPHEISDQDVRLLLEELDKLIGIYNG